MEGFPPEAQGRPSGLRPRLTAGLGHQALRVAWQEASQLTPGSAPVVRLCLCNSASWTLAGYQICGPAAQIAPT